MECSVNKEKIKQGITDTIKQLVEATGLFNIVEDKVFSKNIPSSVVPELTEDQLKKIEDSKKYANDVDVIYRQGFLDNPVDFLRHIALQANSSRSEQDGAIGMAGWELFDLAVSLFSNEGLLQSEREATERINDQFKDEVLIKTGVTEWTIHPSDELALQYLAAQPSSSEQIIESLRDHYLSQFTSTSLNLLDENLWINHPALQDPTIQRLISFARKINPNFRIIVTDNLDVNAVSLIRDNIIFIRQGSIISELPEEISHFFFELLPDDNPIKIEMLEKIVDFPIYLETYRKYKDNPAYQINGHPDINKIKREASAKLIGEYIKAAYENKADEKYGKKRSWLKNIIHKIMKFFRRAFITHSAPIYSEPEFDINSPFRQAATQVLDENIGNLNLEKIPSIYDSVFFSTIEDELEEGYEASDVAKSLYEFSQQLKNQLTRTFFKYSQQENMKGLMEYLQDPNNKNINKIWDFINRLRDVSENFVDSDTSTYISLIQGASTLAEVYREMEQIPLAIRKALSTMSKDKTEDQLINNIIEMQNYTRFSDTFEKISDEFVNLLKILKDKYSNKTPGIDIGNIYDIMVDKMGNTATEFKVLDLEIMSKFQKHLINLLDVSLDEYFKKYTDEKTGLYNQLENNKLKSKVARKLKEQVTSIEQVKQAVLGEFPKAKELMLPDGNKVNIDRIKDISQRDYAIFLFSSPTLISDPIVANAVKFFTERYMIGTYKGAREAKVFADSIVPLKKELQDAGLDWYESAERIQNVQSFYDDTVDDNVTQKRTYISQTNRFDGYYQNQLKRNEITQKKRELDNLQKIDKSSIDEEALKTKITEKQSELKTLQDDYQKWLKDWWNRPFTDEFYELQKKLQANKNDTPALKRWKEVNAKILELEHIQFIGIASDNTFNDTFYTSITQQIAALQNEKLQLQDKVPQTEKETLEILEKLYEVDEVRTSRLRYYHKLQWVRSFVQSQIEIGSKKSKEELDTKANDSYDALYTLVVPKQEFYDERSRIFDEINKVTRPVVGLDKLSARLEELKEKEKKLLKPFRDMRGEINITSFKYISLEKDSMGRDKLISESLKELEEEIDMINSKMRIYSTVLSSSSISDKEKSQILAFVDLSLAFSQVINNQLVYNADDVKMAFTDLIPLSTSQAEQILSAIRKSAQGDNSEFNALSNLQLNGTSQVVKVAYSVLNFSSPQEMMDAENAVYGAFKHFTRRERGMLSELVAHLYDELNNLYSNTVSLQYYLALGEFFSYYQQYVNQDDFNLPDKDIHTKKFIEMRGTAPATVADVENMLGDGVFEGVIMYMNWLEGREINPTRAYPLSDLADFLISIHKQKSTFVDGEMITTWTPISYVRKPNPDPSFTEKKSPRFLTVNKIKDEYRTTKIYETDPEVINGNKTANVDINGEWLPLNKKDSPFWNAEYEKLKSARPDTIDGKLFKLLQAETQAYLQAQVEYLSEGDRLDLVIPAKYIDKLEQKKVNLQRAEDVWEYIKNITPFIKGDKESEQSYFEEIGVLGVQNRDIYTGRLINEAQPKLRSFRRIPLERTSKDTISSVAMFFEDVNEWSAKNLVAPVMKTYADVFKYAFANNPRSNKLRSETLDWLYKTKALDEVPRNAANNETLAKALRVANTLATFRLLADPVGALINLTSGTLQQLIEANWSKEEFRLFMSEGWRAKNWLYQYDRDFYRQSNWGLQTQLIGVFNMIPDNFDISTHLSTRALLANVRSKLMAPRTETEKYMAIHMGLAVVMAEPIVHEGNKVTIEDIYELDPVTNLVRLKNEFRGLEKEWNPIDGTKVVMLRSRLTQKYTLLQGNFFKQNQSFASTTALGKSAEIMKRWFASGIIRRYQGERVDIFTGDVIKGYHLAMANAVQALFYGVRSGDMKYINEYFTKVMKRPSEKMAMRRAAAEFLYTFAFGVLGFMVLGYDDDDENKNKKLREMGYAKQLALLVTLRVQGELGTFIPIPLWGLGYMEMKRAILDPFGLPKGAFDNIMGLGALTIMQILDSIGLGDYDKFLYYQKGKPYAYNFFGAGAIKDKGDSKLWALILNTIGYTGYTFEPGEYIKTLTQMQQRIK